MQSFNGHYPIQSEFGNGKVGHFDETDSGQLETDGTIPHGLNGKTFFLASNRGGHGQISAFYFKDGRASYKERLIHTPKYAYLSKRKRGLPANINAFDAVSPRTMPKLGGGVLSGVSMGARKLLGWGPTQSQYQKMLPFLYNADANIISLHGKLLALINIGHPVALDPATLATIEPDDFCGALREPVTSHWLTDTQTNDTYAIGYSPFPPFMQLYSFKVGEKVCYQPVHVPFPGIMHSFSLTPRYFVFFHMPATFFLKNIGASQPVKWQPELGARIGILPRDGSEPQPTWFDVPPYWSFHCMNSYDDGDTIVTILTRFPSNPALAPQKPDDDGHTHRSVLVQWVLNVKSGRLEETILNGDYAEFPTIDAGFLGQKQAHGWFAALRDEAYRPRLWNTVWHLNFTERTDDCYTCEKGSHISVCVFTPLSAHAPEGCGYILTVMQRSAEADSRLLIFDAQNISGGPVAAVKLPRLIPGCGHGCIV